MYILALDLETTGLDPNYNEIIQIGAILLDNQLNEIDRFETLVCPNHPERGYRKEFDVYKYTGISEDSLRGAPLLERALRKLEEFVHASILKTTCSLPTTKLKEVVLLGQNTGFDQSFLRAAYRSLGHEDMPFDHHCIAVDSAYFFFKILRNEPLNSARELSLKEAAKCLDVPLVKAHNALQDVEATVNLLRKMLSQS